MMNRRRFSRWLPSHERLREHKALRPLAPLLGNPALWHLNRRSASGAVGIGLLMAWIPLPCQMLLSALAATWLRANLPVAVSLVWLTNPFTMPPLFYLAYQCGSRLLGMPPVEFQPQLEWQWLMGVMQEIGIPFLLGSAVLGLGCSLLGFLAVRLAWRISVQRRWQVRRQRRLEIAQ